MILFNALDLLVFAFLVLSGVFGWRQGFPRQARALIKWLGIAIAPFYIYLGLEPSLSAYVESPGIVKVLAIVLSFLIAWLIMSYTTKIWKEKSTKNNVLEQVLSVIGGATRMFLILYLVWVPINAFWSKDSYPQILKESRFEEACLVVSNLFSLILPDKKTPQEYLLAAEKIWQNE